jgi:hypothetical protein
MSDLSPRDPNEAGYDDVRPSTATGSADASTWTSTLLEPAKLMGLIVLVVLIAVCVYAFLPS